MAPDLSTADGSRTALAELTAEFMATPPESRDVNYYRAAVSGLVAILEDFSRKSRDALEGDIELLNQRLSAWERETNVNT